MGEAKGIGVTMLGMKLLGGFGFIDGKWKLLSSEGEFC